MKKFFTLIIIAMFTANLSYSAAIEKVSTTSVTLYNFSLSSYDLTNHMLTIGNSWHLMSTLTVLSGNLNLPASQSVTVGGLTIPNGTGSVALWQPGTNSGNASSSNIIDFVQYGAGGQAFEAIAVQAFLILVNTYAPGALPIRRTDANQGPGNGNWVQDATGIISSESIYALQFMPNPVSDRITISMSPDFFSASPSFNCSLLDASGRLWISESAITSQQAVINCKALPAGMYFVQITSASGATLQRKRVMKL